MSISSYTQVTTNFFKTRRGIYLIRGMSSTCIVNFIIMRQICKFNDKTDITSVVPSLGVDVNSAIESGIITDTSANVFHNEMNELSEVGIVARDSFDIIEYERSYSKFRKYVKDNESKPE